jgi:N-acetylglucosamine-6-phosphate deacetylase
VATHLFNGMRPPHHREPGPAVGLLSSTATVELIADNIHLHPGMLAFAARSAGPDRTILVTDAMDATGMPDGSYELGGQAVVVADRVARLAQGGSIAGSTLTMDVAFRNAVTAGLPLTDAAAMSSTTPARLLGLTDRGALAPSLRADVVVLTADLTFKQVIRAGTDRGLPDATQARR